MTALDEHVAGEQQQAIVPQLDPGAVVPGSDDQLFRGTREQGSKAFDQPELAKRLAQGVSPAPAAWVTAASSRAVAAATSSAATTAEITATPLAPA